LAAGSDDDPTGDAADVKHLVTSNQEDWKIGRTLALFKDADPPPNGDASVNQDVEESQDQAAGPPKNQPEKHAVDTAMHPGGGVRQADFVHGHPFILKQPIANQVNHQSRFEEGQAHEILFVIWPDPQTELPTTGSEAGESVTVAATGSHRPRDVNLRSATSSRSEITGRFINGLVSVGKSVEEKKAENRCSFPGAAQRT
jgi:hypothetical protein